ncbi:tetraacyldisaccharide 4'-kinase [Algoriphagus sp.]|uniref:tetraacyldisaccharide 4'-kinase n=1 Tax=Algoriphagus sp. TaxID=1872435 RepID=UPI0025D68082|nr:tetraacyldisaccharide 4'-kinase [Algoriphagus sp.]
MRPYAFLLYPFAVLYNLITKIRNWFFELGWLKKTNSPIKSILVGNLSVGGTGKTPMVEYLIEKVKSRQKTATLSRGYGRKTKGFHQAKSGVKPSEIGDEPFQIFEKYGEEISVFVGEKRVEALNEIALNFPECELIILDDAFQHRYVQADSSILLTTFDQPFFSDFLLPVGRLRENRNGAKRADLIVVTKCPQGILDTEKKDLIKKIRKYNQLAPILFSSLGYGKPYPIHLESPFTRNVILLSGIANDKQLREYVSENFNLLETLKYPDHHEYVASDFKKIKQLVEKNSSQNPIIITTEKDAVKVKSYSLSGILEEIPIFVLPIQVVFSQEDEQYMESFIEQVILQKK